MDLFSLHGYIPKEQNLKVSVSHFEYTPDEILPGGNQNEETIELGENHFKVIDLIIQSSGNGYALNNSNSLFHELLETNNAVYSNQKTSGGNLKFVLDVKYNTYGLYYCVEKASDTLYYIYTFTVDDLSSAAGTNTEICVYKTLVEKTNDEWVAKSSALGYAKTARMRDLGVSSVSQSIDYNINVDSWHLPALG